MGFEKPVCEHSSGLLGLPTELLLLIAEYTPSQDLCRLIRVSQRTRTVLTDTLYLRNIHERDSSGLAWTVKNNHVEAACRFLRLNANANTTAGLAPLLSAVMNENLRLVKILVKAGARPGVQYIALSKDPRTLKTPLGIAIYKGNASIARILIDATANLERAALGAFTPLGVACYAQHVEIARYLLEKGVKPDIPESLVDKLLDVDNDYLQRSYRKYRLETQRPHEVHRQRLRDGPLAVLRLLVPYGLKVPERQQERAQTHSDPRVRYLFMAGTALKEAKKREEVDEFVASEVEYNEVFPPLDTLLDAQVDCAKSDALQSWSNFREQIDAPRDNSIVIESSDNVGKRRKKKWSKLQL